MAFVDDPARRCGRRQALVEGRTGSLALYGAGLFAHRAGDIDESHRLNEEALDLADTPGTTTLAHLGLSRVAAERGDAEEALRHALEAREAAAALGESMGPALLHVHATALRLRGDLDQAAELFEQSLAFNSRIGDVWMVDVERYNLGFVNLRRGDTSAAVQYLSDVDDDPLAAAAVAFVKATANPPEHYSTKSPTTTCPTTTVPRPNGSGASSDGRAQGVQAQARS